MLQWKSSALSKLDKCGLRAPVQKTRKNEWIQRVTTVDKTDEIGPERWLTSQGMKKLELVGEECASLAVPTGTTNDETHLNSYCADTSFISSHYRALIMELHSKYEFAV